ncbi:MAG: hypothetical protein KF781_10580 [Chitinophagaceae bacterium]|nr:hypothetical protein [Chitinophagaceae bacterium]MCW5904962.1 hypothetical protein [Chitinophagaceae bacterium]
MKQLIYLLSCLLLFSSISVAQPFTPTIPIPMPSVPTMRQLNHDIIDKTQKLITRLDGVDDDEFIISSVDTVNEKINDALHIIVDNMQANVELNTNISENNKYKWLRGINDMLNAFVSGYKAKVVKGNALYNIIIAYRDAMDIELNNQSIKPIVEKYDFEVGEILIGNFALKTNIGIPYCHDVILYKKIQRYPKKTMSLLSQNPQAAFADSIIISNAFKDPEQLYNYAAAPNALGKKIQSVNHPLVKQIGLLALMRTGRMYFPFLDNLYRGKITMENITKVLNDSLKYYQLLVQTQIDYANRVKNNDTPLVMKVLTNRLKTKAVELYITPINGLHDEKDNIRFACLEPLTPEDLYYVAVLGEEEIYTSSYLGVYKRIFEKMKHPVSDTLLNWVHYDYYKKFIKIAANYNTLDDFLRRMNKDNAERLMRNFVSGLEKTTSLEDAVDVANSYASIYNPKIKQLILSQIEENLLQSEKEENKRGQTIYNLLNIIFQSMDSTKKIDVASRLGITGIYQMPIKNLKDSSGRIIIQQFFYGDKDGKTVFNSFFKYYPSPLWKKTETENWVELHTTKGVPISIYCNKPLDNEADLDIKAQEALGRYLEENELYPTIVIHRGHSYFVGSTIDQLPSSAKVVLLGSCGGYQRLNDVLETCPEAHIISSKQTGTGAVNINLINAIINTIRLNKNLNWPTIWKNLETHFTGTSKERFDDYVPPHKNLGAIFIMAYQIAMQQEESDNE